MERELFTIITRAVHSLPGACTAPPKCQYTDACIVLTLLWAVVHDRPVDWACRRRNWPWHDRTRRLPSGATMSRRLRTDSVRDLLLATLERLNIVPEPHQRLILDGKALAIAWHSADPDAKVGRGAGGLAKGYKLHMIVDETGNLVSFLVTALNVGEQQAARTMIESIDHGRGTQMLADSNYDSSALYDAAASKGVQLIADKRYKKAKGLGHHYQSPHRLKALAMMQADHTVLDPRRRIEGCFGTLGNVTGGLCGLPNWVRRIDRVERWIAAKLMIDAAHRRLRRGHAVA